MEYNKEKRKAYLEANKEKIKQQKKENYLVNKKERLKYQSLYGKENKDKINEYYKKKRKEDPLYKLKGNTRNMVKNSVNGFFKKTQRTEEILGCELEFFKAYLESLWEDWMNWDNYGLYNGSLKFGWDVDHIIPLSTAKTIEDVIKLNHYTNLQPLCSYTNRVIKRDS